MLKTETNPGQLSRGFHVLHEDNNENIILYFKTKPIKTKSFNSMVTQLHCNILKDFINSNF